MSEHDDGESDNKSSLVSNPEVAQIKTDDGGAGRTLYVIPVNSIPKDQMSHAFVANDDRYSDQKIPHNFAEYLGLQKNAPLIAKLAETSYAAFQAPDLGFLGDGCMKSLIATVQEGSTRPLFTKKDLNFVIHFADPKYKFGKGSNRMSKKIDMSEVLSCEFVNQSYYNSATQRMLYMACRWFGLYGKKIETPRELHAGFVENGFKGNGFEDYAHSIVKLIIGRPLSQEELPRQDI